MNASALATVFRDIGWAVEEADFPAQVKRSRELLAMADSVHPSRLDAARRIVAAAGGDPSERPGYGPPGSAETERKREAEKERLAEKETRELELDAEGDHALLGLLPDGQVMSAAACRAAGRDPVEYLAQQGATLTPAGRVVKDTLLRVAAEDPHRRALARAAELELDVVGIRKWAAANGRDFHVTLHAAIETAEQLAREKPLVGIGV